MKVYVGLVALSGLVISVGANAKKPASPTPPAELAGALKAMAPPAKPPKPEHDQGDEHASPRAKDVVCTKNTPAAQRSAICPQSTSPD